jgi:hypothetical protein
VAELQALDVRPLPHPRTLERVRQRNGWTAPRVRLAPLLPRPEWPGPQARAANERHAVDLVGPVDLLGSGHRYSLWIGKDVCDGAVCLRLAASRTRDEVRWFLSACGKALGRPEQVPLDHARARCGWGQSAYAWSRVIRRCLRSGVRPVFLPEGEPPCNGSVANVHGWFHEPLFPRRFRRPGDLRREWVRLPEAVPTPHVHPRLGGKTPAQHRRGLRLHQLPTSFVVPAGRLPLAEGRVTFLRRGSLAGTVPLLRPSFRVGKNQHGLYLRLVIDTGRGTRTAYRTGRIVQRWPYQLFPDEPTPRHAAAVGCHRHSA